MKSLFFLLLFLSASVFGQVVTPQTYNVRMNDIIEVTATTTSTKVVDVNARRKYLMVQNKGPETILMKYDTIHTGSEGIKILPGGYYEPLQAPNNSIWIKSNSATSSVVIYQGSN